MLIWFCFVLHESWWINMKYCLIYNLHVMRICLMYLFLSSGKNSGKTLKLAHCSSSSSWRRWRSSAMRRPYSNVASTARQLWVDRSWSCADPKLWLCFFESTIAGHASTLLWLGFLLARSIWICTGFDPCWALVFKIHFIFSSFPSICQAMCFLSFLLISPTS